MVDGETFTDAVNYKRVAKLLHRKGYTLVPELTVIRTIISGDERLYRWFRRQLEPNDANFTALLAFHMTHERPNAA